MADEPTTATHDETAEPQTQAGASTDDVTDVLVEEVSIDGMCGVY